MMLSFLIKQGVSSLIDHSVDEAVLKRLSKAVLEARGDRSQREFAELLDVAQSTVQSWENGKNTPSLENMEKIARIRGQLPEEFVAYLYGRQGEASLQDRINAMSQSEIAWLMVVIARKLGADADQQSKEPPQ
jgi:transcriptional regulator with XRE-family HTH domain